MHKSNFIQFIFSTIKHFFRGIMERISRLNRVLTYFSSEKARLLAELALVKDQLAVALENDAADQAAIATAQEEARVARLAAAAAATEVERLNQVVSEDVAEDTQLDALISSAEAELPVE